MTKTFRNCLALSFLLTASWPGFAGTASTGKVDPGFQITVRVYNYAQVPGWTLERAQWYANRVFHNAGVEAVWLDCRLAKGQTAPACKDALGPTELILRILSQSRAARAAFGRTASGFALSGGSLSTLFYDRVEEEADRVSFSRDLILGHVVAHEIGHLLLSSGAHSPRGIMRAHWRRVDLQHATDGMLLFTPQQCELIRAAVRARMRQQEVVQTSRLPSPK